MSNRERIVQAIAEAIALELVLSGLVEHRPSPDDLDTIRHAADAALRVLEAPEGRNEDYSRICTCGWNGYNGWHKNHDHTEDCPQYDKSN